MLYLDYIIVGSLPKLEQELLLKNLAEEGTEPEAGRAVEPEADRTVKPEEDRAVESEAGRAVESEAGRAVEPEEDRTAEPEEDRTAKPEEDRIAEPEEDKTVEPGTPRPHVAVLRQTSLEDSGKPQTQLRRFPAERSILVSGDRGELAEAAALGMAALGYLPPQESGTDVPEYGESSASDAPPADMYAEGFAEIGLTFLRHVYERHHDLPWTILETERCIVKEFSMDYLDDLFELYAGEGMTDYIEPLYPYEEERRYQQAYMENMYRFYGYGMWIICEKETGKLIGRAGVERREELDGELELGYAVGTPWQQKGYATEVCTAILKYVRDELEFPSVCCLIEEGNTVSEHLAEKLGMGWRDTLTVNGKKMKKYIRFF